jgi:glutaredoxin 3
MREIIVYTSLHCGYCSAAKQLLSSRGYKYEEINMQGDEDLMIEVMQKSGQRTVPQIFVGEHSVGGYQELLAALVNDDFEELVNPVG